MNNISHIYSIFTSVEEMELKKQAVSLPVKNIDEAINTEPPLHKHSSLLPNSIRCLICGPSSCGKTNVIISLLENPNGLRFKNVYIYSKSLYQPKYIYLKELLNSIPQIHCYLFSSKEAVITPDEAEEDSVFIFDDVICDKQDVMKSFFCMGRHKGIDCFYLCQSYVKVPKNLIRENTNFLIIFKQDGMNLKHIFDDFSVNADMNFNDFKHLCNKCWNQKHGFMVIDITREKDDGRYRLGFDAFFK